MQFINTLQQIKELKQKQALPLLLLLYLEIFMDGRKRNPSLMSWQDPPDESEEAIVVLEEGETNDFCSFLGVHAIEDNPCDCSLTFVAQKILMGRNPQVRLKVYHLLVRYSEGTALNLFTTVGSLDDSVEPFLARAASRMPVEEITVWPTSQPIKQR